MEPRRVGHVADFIPQDPLPSHHTSGVAIGKRSEKVCNIERLLATAFTVEEKEPTSGENPNAGECAQSPKEETIRSPRILAVV